MRESGISNLKSQIANLKSQIAKSPALPPPSSSYSSTEKPHKVQQIIERRQAPKGPIKLKSLISGPNTSASRGLWLAPKWRRSAYEALSRKQRPCKPWTSRQSGPLFPAHKERPKSAQRDPRRARPAAPRGQQARHQARQRSCQRRSLARGDPSDARMWPEPLPSGGQMDLAAWTWGEQRASSRPTSSGRLARRAPRHQIGLCSTVTCRLLRDAGRARQPSSLKLPPGRPAGAPV